MNQRTDCCLKCKHWREPLPRRKNATCAAEEERETPCAGTDNHDRCCGCTAFEVGTDRADDGACPCGSGVFVGTCHKCGREIGRVM